MKLDPTAIECHQMPLLMNLSAMLCDHLDSCWNDLPPLSEKLMCSEDMSGTVRRYLTMLSDYFKPVSMLMKGVGEGLVESISKSNVVCMWEFMKQGFLAKDLLSAAVTRCMLLNTHFSHHGFADVIVWTRSRDTFQSYLEQYQSIRTSRIMGAVNNCLHRGDADALRFVLECTFQDVVHPPGSGIVDMIRCCPWENFPEFCEDEDVHPLRLEVGLERGVCMTAAHFLKLGLRCYATDPSLLVAFSRMGLTGLKLSQFSLSHSDVMLAALEDFVEFVRAFIPDEGETYSTVHVTLLVVRLGALACTDYLLQVIQEENITTSYGLESCVSVFMKLLQPGNIRCLLREIYCGFIPLTDVNTQAMTLACHCHAPVLREHLTLLRSIHPNPKPSEFHINERVLEEIHNCIPIWVRPPLQTVWLLWSSSSPPTKLTWKALMWAFGSDLPTQAS